MNDLLLGIGGSLCVAKGRGFLVPTRPPLLRRAGRVGLCFLVICEKGFDFRWAFARPPN